MFYAVSVTPGVWNKLKIIFGKPEMLDQNIRPQLEKIYLQPKTASKTTFRYKAYLVIQIIVNVLILFLVTLFYFQIGLPELTASTLFILITLINCGALLEQRTWIYYLEYLRLIVVISYISYCLEQPLVLFVSILGIALLLWSNRQIRPWYLNFIYG